MSLTWLRLLYRLKVNKAPGHDHIPPRALKASIPYIARHLSHLITENYHHFEASPLLLETRRDCHTKGSQLEKEDFQPVTVLPAVSQTFEHLVHQQLTIHLEKIFHNS